MADGHASAYSPEQVLDGLRVAWPLVSGDTEPFTPETSFLERFEDCFADTAPDQAIRALDCFFSAGPLSWRDWKRRCRPEWRQWVGPPAHMSVKEWERRRNELYTFRALAEFLARRHSPLSLEPAMVLGRPCATAGAFQTIERTVAVAEPDTRRFAPSDRVRSVLRGQALRLVWNRLRWQSANRLPPLRPSWVTRAEQLVYDWRAFVVGLASAGLVATALWACAGMPWGFTAIMASIACFLLREAGLTVVRCLEGAQNALPSGITTFADMARAMVSGGASTVLPDRGSAAASAAE